MLKKLCVVALGCLVLAVAGPAGADDRLAQLIPGLFGPSGLVVNSEALLPNGQTHSAHFNSAFQAEFTQFNVALASQLASLPLPSPASGFTYEFDRKLSVLTRSTRSFGPILSDRAETVGKKKLSFGFNYQRFTFDRIEGVDLAAVPAVFSHDNPAKGTGRDDVVTTANDIKITLGRFTAFVNYGLLDGVDLAVAVPVVDTQLDVTSLATIRRIGTVNPAIHFFRDANGGFGTTQTFRSFGQANGIGDVVVRLKGRLAKWGSTAVALGLDARLPTGDEENLLGSGALGLKPFLVLSSAHRVLSPHVNVGYQWNDKSVLAGDVATGRKEDLPRQVLYSAGLAVGASDHLTISFDVLGRYTLEARRLVPVTFNALDGHSTFPDISFVKKSYSETNGAVGVKMNLFGRMLIDANVLFALDDTGLRDRVTPLVGVEYSF